MKKFAVTLFLLLFVSAAWSQAKLGLYKPFLDIDPDSVNFNQWVNYSGYVENKGNDYFTGGISMYFQINGSAPTVFDVINADSLAPGDTIPFNIDNYVTTAKYQGGDNLITVWPVADDQMVLTTDTASGTLYVDPASSTDPEEVERRISIWPNPVKGNLNVRYEKDVSEFEGVRVLDFQGREVFYSDQPVESIGFEDFEKGIYLMEVRYKDGVRATYKLINF